jgi:hypothetical protein
MMIGTKIARGIQIVIAVLMFMVLVKLIMLSVNY